MKKIFIEYNPYMVKTIIYIDSEISHYNSTFIEKCNKRLQEWVDDIPEMLCTEYNERESYFMEHLWILKISNTVWSAILIKIMDLHSQFNILQPRK